MAVRNLVKKAFIRQIQTAASAGVITFTQAVQALEANAYNIAKTGQRAVSVQANGQSYEFATPDGANSIGELGLLELCEEIRDRQTNARAYLISLGTVAPTDSQVTTQMLTDLSDPPLSPPMDFRGMVK